MSHLWMFATNCQLGYPRCKTKNHWRSVDADFQCVEVTVSLAIGLYRLLIGWFRGAATKLLVDYRIYATNNRWHSIDAHCNVLFIQNVLPWIIGLIITWFHWLPNCLIETWPFGKVEPSTVVVLVALILLNWNILPNDSFCLLYYCVLTNIHQRLLNTLR